jgi:hypothetical protein
VEGVNMLALLLGNLALVIFGMALFVAFGLLVARMTKAARLFFAVAVLCASVIAAVAILTFLQPEFHETELGTRIVLPALTFLLAGAGQFVAALRNSRTYAAAVACAVGALLLLTAPWLGDVLRIPGGYYLLTAVGFVPLVVASLLLAATSLLLAVLR